MTVASQQESYLLRHSDLKRGLNLRCDVTFSIKYYSCLVTFLFPLGNCICGEIGCHLSVVLMHLKW